MRAWDEYIEKLKRDIAEIAKNFNVQSKGNIKNNYCEVCGKPATMHEGRHNFCRKHWQEWVREG